LLSVTLTRRFQRVVRAPLDSSDRAVGLQAAVGGPPRMFEVRQPCGIFQATGIPNPVGAMAFGILHINYLYII